jgi:hypothetical protein
MADEPGALEGPEMYGRLRAMALDAVALGLPAPPPEHPGVSGLVVDIPAGGGAFATLVAMGDGSTSLYSSTGGGTIGAGAHPAVAAATHELLALIDERLDEFGEDDDTEQPIGARVRFFVLTPDGRRVADVPDEAFWGGAEHEFTPVIAAVQQVIGALRQVSG